MRRESLGHGGSLSLVARIRRSVWNGIAPAHPTQRDIRQSS
jgi:hypothetical protein